jgi:hypothetical protein
VSRPGRWLSSVAEPSNTGDTRADSSTGPAFGGGATGTRRWRMAAGLLDTPRSRAKRLRRQSRNEARLESPRGRRECR